MDWSSFTKGYFLNRDTLVGVLLLIDASIPPQKIDLDCANWLGRNNVRQYAVQLIILFHLMLVCFFELTYFLCCCYMSIIHLSNRILTISVLLLVKKKSVLLFQIGLTFVFTKCDKVKKGKGGRPDENIKQFQETISGLYPEPPPWIMTSSVTGLGRDGLLLHMSQLRNYWDNEAV